MSAAHRTLAITQNITLDGSIEMLDTWFEPQAQGDADDLLAEIHRQDQRSDAFLVGRRTFEDLREYWPRQVDDRTGVTAYLNQVQKYVVSRSMTDPQWEHTTILGGGLVEEVQRLKQSPGADIVTTGSISVCHQLIEAGLVDEYRLFIYPAVQGRGRRLFPDGYQIPKLGPIEIKPFKNGVIYAGYRVAVEEAR